MREIVFIRCEYPRIFRGQNNYRPLLRFFRRRLRDREGLAALVDEVDHGLLQKDRRGLMQGLRLGVVIVCGNGEL